MASEYQLVILPPGLPTTQAVRRTNDGAIIPFDGGNRDYQDYLAWLDKGNTPDEAEAPTP